MKSLQNLRYQQNFRSLPNAFYQDTLPQGLDTPELVIFSKACAQLLHLDPASLTEKESLQMLSGQTLHDAWRPLAMRYFGHQFGYLNPELGDGRGVLLADVVTPKGEHWDLHLKGSGTTDFSRDGDGRAVLRSSIREFLCSEAMAALNVPTTRALSIVTSDTLVQREAIEKAAMLMRVAKTHIRFGHFEFAYHSKDQTLLNSLCDHVAQRHFPDIFGHAQQNETLFKRICEATGHLLATWQCLGFAHGVMNTDNMSIIGDTFDYGPYGFMERFKPSFICNGSDHQGRYAFDRQPAIGQWNLSVLAQAFSPIVEKKALNAGLLAYSETFNSCFIAGMRAKLGLQADSNNETDQALVMDTFKMLERCNFDYSNFFRQLSEINVDETLSQLRNDALDLKVFEAWQAKYKARLENETYSLRERSTQMKRCNPKYILRNYLAQNAIEKAQQGDYSEVKKLHQVLTKPFDEQPEHAAYAASAPEWATNQSVSCSS